VVLLAHFIYQNDKLNWKKIFGLVTGFAGIILVNWGQAISLDFSFYGEGFLIMAGLTSAVATILAKRLTQDINAFLLTGWQMVIGAFFLFLAGFLAKGSVVLNFTPLAGGLLIYSVFLSAAAFSLWYAILKFNKAGEIAVYRFMIPVSGAILSSIFVPGEDLNKMVIQALILVALGIFAVNHSPDQ
jgi:drug/metabolite transporter (DMT)-like permease